MPMSGTVNRASLLIWSVDGVVLKSATCEADALTGTALPPGDNFYPALAEAILGVAAAQGLAGDLSSLRVVVPALPMAAELRQALVRVAGRPLLLPTLTTFTLWAQSAAVGELPVPLAESERLVLLHEALRGKEWFDESALWGIAAEMGGLFDELTRAADVGQGGLPSDEAALAALFESAYELRASVPLAFEARVVHELWRALAAAGSPDVAGLHRLSLAALAQVAHARPRNTAPLCVLLDAVPAESLVPAEREFLRAWSAVQPLSVFYPEPREAGRTPLARVLAAAWPVMAADSGREATPLYERAMQLAQDLPESPLAGRLACVAAEGREAEARAAVAQLGAWLQSGLRRIALVAQDRLTARRVRALLEREGVLVSDETGWKLSTSRAAATIDALLETVATQAYHRDLLDLCKSPYVFADVAPELRQAAVHALEMALRAASVRRGLACHKRAVQAGAGDDPVAHNQALLLLDRLGRALSLLDSTPASLGRWLGRLQRALVEIGADEALAGDTAGQAVLELIETRRAELGSSTASFSFTAWRDWLNREFEGATFRDAAIDSPLVMTALNAVCLRRFEAVLLLGGDARLLAPVVPGAFFNNAVRRELGLRTREDAERELRRDLELLLATVPRVVVTWQSAQDGEENRLASDLSVLLTLHALAWGDDLQRAPLAARPQSEPDAMTAPSLADGRCAAPAVPTARVPLRISVSAYASLVACPYRFYARHVLGLGELDEVSEDLDKRGYGELVHRVLERFHAAHPQVSALAPEVALSALRAQSDDVFAAALADNFLATGWRLRWEKRLAAYLDWQRGLEAEGWQWARAEIRAKRRLPLPDGAEVELYGRLDRVDTRSDGAPGIALYDYKTQRAAAISARLPDDIQLPVYALLCGEEANVERAAYVALDDERIVAVSAGNPTASEAGASLEEAAKAQGERLVRALADLRAGASLPAHGAESVCGFCEMRGLCRRGHV